MTAAEDKAFKEKTDEEILAERRADWARQLMSQKEKDVNQKQSAGGFRLLQQTSQGCRFDVPPTEWVEEELLAFGARRPNGTTRIPDLRGEIHPAFRQERWPGMPPHRFDALRQSLLFASNLLHVSSAALTSFFPNVLEHAQRNVGYTKSQSRRVVASPIDDYKVFTAESYRSIMKAAQCFASLASSITWVESPKILSKNSWMGIMTSGITKPEQHESVGHWEAARERDEDKGHKTRHVTIAIASEFVDAILDSKPDSERRLFATFYAGINIAHEVAHFWASHRYATIINPGLGEPFFADCLDMELGDAYISWMFGGFVPHPIGTAHQAHMLDQGMQWERRHHVGMTESGYDILYSMKISHIERMLSHDEWTTQFKLKNPGASRRALLHPTLPFRINETARTIRWHNLYGLAGRGPQFDRRGLAKKGDAGFIDYSLCPLGFCDLDWDDVPERDASNLAGCSRQILKSTETGGGKFARGLKHQPSSPQSRYGSSVDAAGNLDLEQHREQGMLSELESRLQNGEQSARGTFHTLYDAEDENMKKGVKGIEDDTPDILSMREEVTPLPAAARHFFRHDMPKKERQRLENKLRLFHHEKELERQENQYDFYRPLARSPYLDDSGNIVFEYEPDRPPLRDPDLEYDSDDPDPIQRVKLNCDNPYGNVEAGNLHFSHPYTFDEVIVLD